MATSVAGHEIDGFPHGHVDAEIQGHAALLAGRAGNVAKPVGHVRLRAEIELHVGMHRKGVPAFQAGALPFAVRLHGSSIDHELTLLAHGTADGLQAGFDLLDTRT